MFRKRAVWVVLGVLAAGCAWFAAVNFHAAAPLVTLDLQMDRGAALGAAAELAAEHGWGPPVFRQAASFRQLDRQVQMYVELEGGGREVFQRMLDEGRYHAYVWAVRHFREGEATETEIRFTPAGEAYGFRMRLPEDEPGASLAAAEARALAEAAARSAWRLALDPYELIEASQETRPGGRTDHWFVYQRTDVEVEEARYRVRLAVAGDRFSELSHFVHVPEGFDRRFAEMRSRNDLIALGAGIAFMLLFVVGGAGVGLFFLLRRRWVIWRAPLVLGVGAAFLVFLAGLNQLPLSWMFYDTAVSRQSFLWQQLALLAAGLLGLCAFFTLMLIAAEGLSRRAFPEQLQLWRLWSRGVGGSDPVLGRTLGGYGLTALALALVVAFYLVMMRLPGWWSPSDTLLVPDLLATKLPSLSAIALAFQAGLWEESVFRAIPIACAALIGARLGGRRLWIGGAVVLQALVFAAAHADYPQQPAYARILELFPDALLWGLVYLAFGLLPVILTHFLYNLVWMSLPLFVAEDPGLWLDRGLIVAAALVPLGVVLASRLRHGARTEAPEEALNRAWAPAPVAEAGPVEDEPQHLRHHTPPTAGPRARHALVAAALVGLALYAFATPFRADAPRLATDRREAIAVARAELAEREFVHEASWRALTSVHGGGSEFVWRSGGKEAHDALLGRYVDGPQWHVRFARFEGPVEERAEELVVEVAHDGGAHRVRHRLPEGRPGAVLEEEEARAIARAAVTGELRLDGASLPEVSAVADRHPERQDWTFTFADREGYPLDEGEARIRVVVAGDEVSDVRRFVHVPDEWSRARRAEGQRTMLLGLAAGVLFALLLAAGAGFGVVRWSRGDFPVRATLIVFAAAFGIQVAAALNGWPSLAAAFSTDQPFRFQVFTVLAAVLVSSLILAAVVALVAGLVQTWAERQSGAAFSPPLVGAAAGALAAGLASLAARLTPARAPFVPSVEAAASFVPSVSLAIEPLSGFLLGTVALLLILRLLDRVSRGGSRRRPQTAALALVGGLVLAGLMASEGLVEWLAVGVLAALVLLALHWLARRFHPALVPAFVATTLILSELQLLVLRPHPGAVAGPIFAILLLAAAALIWSRALQPANAR